MQIKNWKLSKLLIKNSTKINVYGNLIAETSKGEKYIPFGASGKTYDLAYKKAMSELSERAAWFTMFSINSNIVPNTTGFAAHTDKNLGKLNSKYEFIERLVFKNLIFLLKNGNIENILNSFTVIEKNNFVFFCKKFKVSNMSLWITISCKFSKDLIAFGMGKRNTLKESISDAIDESLMVSNSIERYLHNQNSTQKNKSMSQEEMVYFVDLGKNKNLRKLICDIRHKKKFNELKKTDKINNMVTFDVTKYMPSFLLNFHRKVFLTMYKDKSIEFEKCFPESKRI